jgi:hypothetical protein
MPLSGERVDFPTTTLNTSTRLTKEALAARTADAAALDRFWEVNEEQRIERLLKASRELGFELPRQCY